MKKILFLSAVFAILTAFSLDVNAPQGKIKVNQGTQLSYAVDFMGNKYDFNVTVTTRDAGVAFDYMMTNDKGTKGKVAISPDAMKNAHKQNNYFAGGEMKMRDATSIWVSDEVFNELKSGNTHIDIGNGKETMVLKEKIKMPVKMGGKVKNLKVLYAETNGNNKFWILDDKSNPIILKMNLGWTIEIKEIN